VEELLLALVGVGGTVGGRDCGVPGTGMSAAIITGSAREGVGPTSTDEAESLMSDPLFFLFILIDACVLCFAKLLDVNSRSTFPSVGDLAVLRLRLKLRLRRGAVTPRPKGEEPRRESLGGASTP